MRSKLFIIITVIAVASMTAGTAATAGATRVSGAIWAHGELYDTVVTPTTFIAPPEHSTDTIYSFMMSGLEGQRSVTVSAPGDPDYNGGRWNVQMVVFTPLGISVHDPDGDGIVNFELTDAEALLEHEALGHIIINDANFYFECPLRPRKNR